MLEDGRRFGNTGAYEEVVGKITFAIDPTESLNQVIINLDRAPRNDQGLVEATADLVILSPIDPQQGNGVALVDIANRGRRTALAFNRGGSGTYGDGFLMNQGFTIIWVGWEFDVEPNPGAIRLEVPSVDSFPVGGLGFAAVRDTASWIKYDNQAVVNADHVLSFGSSQSGRFLRTFLYLGFNTNKSGQQVFDGMIPHIAGASRINLNQPGASPISLGMFDATSFPFADAALRDPVTGIIDGTLGNDRSRMNQPLIFYSNSGVEYWGGGRVAALIHTTPDGTSDLTLPDNIRSYFFAGTQHGPSPFPPSTTGNGQEMRNPTDYWWNMRALLLALTDWVVDRVEPPTSQYPSFAQGNLVTPADMNFPTMPNVRSPHDRTAGARVENHWLNGKDDKGVALPMFVPQVDDDGNETSGIRHPEVSVPLATYTGWNFSDPDRGDPDTLVPLAGSYIPFSSTRTQREAQRDPRQAIEERYPSKTSYLELINEVAEKLVIDGYLLEEDIPQVVEDAGQRWDAFQH